MFIGIGHKWASYRPNPNPLYRASVIIFDECHEMSLQNKIKLSFEKQRAYYTIIIKYGANCIYSLIMHFHATVRHPY